MILISVGFVTLVLCELTLLARKSRVYRIAAETARAYSAPASAPAASTASTSSTHMAPVDVPTPSGVELVRSSVETGEERVLEAGDLAKEPTTVAWPDVKIQDI